MTSAAPTPAIATPAPSTPTSRPGTPLSTPPTAAVSDKPQDDTSRLKLFVSILRKFTQYIDRPETFAAIGKSEDEVGRMLEVLRFWYTKDLKYVKGKPIKPYNSVLGEFFRCNWEVNEEAPPIDTPKKAPPQPPVDPMAPSNNQDPVRVSYITEQTSHHPPMSAYYVGCPARGVHAQGYDQINAKFTGASVRVTPADYNRGIFITIDKRGEEYRLTHPTAYLAGLIKGSLYVSVSDTCYVTCPQTRLKVIMMYEEKGWTSRRNMMQAVIVKYDPQNDKNQSIKEVNEKEVLCRLEGVWQEQIYYWFPNGNSKYDGKGPPADAQLLIDLTPLMPVPKICPPSEEQLPNESRTFWKDLTIALQERRYGDANKVKQDIEQRQRDKVAQRQAQNMAWKPRFFTEVAEEGGQPHLSEDGKLALAGMQNKEFRL